MSLVYILTKCKCLKKSLDPVYVFQSTLLHKVKIFKVFGLKVAVQNCIFCIKFDICINTLYLSSHFNESVPTMAMFLSN